MEIAQKCVACRYNVFIDRAFVRGIHINSEKCLLASPCLSVRLSVRLCQRCSQWMNFLEVWCYKRLSQNSRYACATHAGQQRLQTHSKNMKYLLFLHGNIGYENVHQCYILRTLPVLFCCWQLYLDYQQSKGNTWLSFRCNNRYENISQYYIMCTLLIFFGVVTLLDSSACCHILQCSVA